MVVSTPSLLRMVGSMKDLGCARLTPVIVCAYFCSSFLSDLVLRILPLLPAHFIFLSVGNSALVHILEDQLLAPLDISDPTALCPPFPSSLVSSPRPFWQLLGAFPTCPACATRDSRAGHPSCFSPHHRLREKRRADALGLKKRRPFGFQVGNVWLRA